MNNQKGFAFLIVALIVAAVLVAGGILYYAASKMPGRFGSDGMPKDSSNRSQSATNSTDVLSDWKVYQNIKYRYSFSYPDSFTLSDFSTADSRDASIINKEDPSFIANVSVGSVSIDGNTGKCPAGKTVKALTVNSQSLEICQGDNNRFDFYALIPRETVSDADDIFVEIIGSADKQQQTQAFFEQFLSTFDEAISWQMYRNEQYGFEFKYPISFTLEDSQNTQGVSEELFRIYAHGPYQAEINTNESDFYHPTTNDVKSWVISHGNQYETYYDGGFANKIGSDYEIDGLPALHLLHNTAQAGTYDEFYVIKNGRLFKILIESDESGSASLSSNRNLNLNDPAKWYNSFLQSFKFIDETASWQTYKNEEYGFEVKIPKDWIASGIEEFSANKEEARINPVSGNQITGFYFVQHFISEDKKIFSIESYSPNYNGFEFQPEGYHLNLDAFNTASSVGSGGVKKIISGDGREFFLTEINLSYLLEEEYKELYACTDFPKSETQPFKILGMTLEYSRVYSSLNDRDKENMKSLLESIISTFKFID